VAEEAFCLKSAPVDDHGNSVISDYAKANMFNTYYASVGTVDSGYVPDISSTNPSMCSTLVTANFEEDDVISAIKKLKPIFSPGPDSLPPLLFKNLVYCLSQPLTSIFNQLISVGFVPEDWHKAIIVPVYKKGATGNVANYRPISLTLCVPKFWNVRLQSTYI